MDKKLYQRVCDIYAGAIGKVFVEGEDYIGAEELSAIIPALQSVFDPNDRATIFYSKWNIKEFDNPKRATEHLKHAIRYAKD